MLQMRNPRIMRAIPVLIAVGLAAFPGWANSVGASGVSGPAQTSRYVFLSDQSTLLQTGGIAGVHRTYAVQGQFQLTVDSQGGTAWFSQVDANAMDDSSWRHTLDPNQVFAMTALVGTVVSDTTLDFTGKAANGSAVRITVTVGAGQVHLVAETVPPPNSADFFLFSMDAVAQRKYAGGTGEPADPYQIAAAADLILLGESPGDYDKHFILTADIDLDPNLPGRRVFDRAVISPDTVPGTLDFDGTAFSGVLDGKGHTVSHLTIKGGDYLGLFGYLTSGAEVRDLGVVDVNIISSGDYVGGLVGLNGLGTVSNSYTTGSVSGRHHVGGLVGYNWGSVSSSYSRSSVGGFGARHGGLVGLNEGLVSNSYSAGSVTGTLFVGGLVGYNYWGTVSNSRSTSSVTGGSLVGGLVGGNCPGLVSNSYSAGSVTGTDAVGGLVGRNYGGTVSNSRSTGSVSGTRFWVGGLVGDNGGSVSKSFWDTTTSGSSTSDGGMGLTTAQMQDPNTFLDAGWDFLGERRNGVCEIWLMPAGGGYPELSALSGYAPPLLNGAGTLDDPYVVKTPEDLGTVWYRPTACYRLASDLDLSGMVWSTAVVPTFAGRFDGQGHTIRNMNVCGGGHLGLFGSLARGAVVSGLGLEDVNVAGTGGHVGGLVGSNGGSVSNSYSTGSVRGDGCVGGLVGIIISPGSVSNSYSTGWVSGMDDVGGLVGGTDWGSVSNSYSTGSVSGTGDYVGGLVGSNFRATVLNSFWDTTTSGRDASDGGTGLTTAQMQTATTFLNAGWDFVGETKNGTADIWWINEGKDYPRLWWELSEEESR